MLYHSPLTSPTPNTVDFVLDGTKHVLAGFSAANPKICFHVKVRSSRLASAFATPSSLAPRSLLPPFSLLEISPSSIVSSIPPPSSPLFSHPALSAPSPLDRQSVRENR